MKKLLQHIEYQNWQIKQLMKTIDQLRRQRDSFEKTAIIATDKYCDLVDKYTHLAGLHTNANNRTDIN